MSDTNPNNTKNEIKSYELRRKILKIAKELFLNPAENGIEPKTKAPSKREILSKLTSAEAKFVNENPDIIFPLDMPERQIWDVYLGRNTEKRNEAILRMVAEDDAIIAEKEIISSQPDGSKCLPSKQQILQKLPADEREILLKHRDPVLSTTRSLGELKNSDRLYFLENGKLPVEKRVDTELQDLYLEYVDEQKDFFELYMNFINNLLCELKKYRQVKDKTTMAARIKSSDSALTNDQQKALDDIFGIETIYSTDSEKSKIEKIIASTINIKEEKEKNKSNGYQAYHVCGTPADLNKQFEETELYNKLTELYKDEIYYPNLIYNVGNNWSEYNNKMIKQLKKSWYNIDDNDNMDINDAINNLMVYVEIQSKTISKAMESIHGSSAHYRYEATKKGKEELSEEEEEKLVEEYKKEIQEKYTNIIKINGGKIPLSQVPKMWESKLKGPLKLLDSMETLKHIYPFFIDPKDLESPQQVKKGEDRED